MKFIARSREPRPAPLERPEAGRSGTPRAGSRGQVLVIFAGAAFVLIALMALVIDVSWYWANTLKVQRAADAAAMAGAIYLPGDVTTAKSSARTEATKNGYTDTGVCATSVCVTPTQDTTDPRQLDVQVSAPVGTFFMRIIGINSITATRTAKALYVLPVPMGSPLAYYGVGDFYVTAGKSVSPFAVPSTTWSNPARGWNSGANSGSNSTTSGTNNQAQAWSTFNIPAITSTTISGVVVSFNANVSTASTACKVMAEVSWVGSTPVWGNKPQTSVNLKATDATYSLGSSGDPGAWDSGKTSWTPADFTNANFRVRLTYQKGSSCGTLSLNQLTVTVYQHPPTKDPGGTVLASQGGWGAIITKGGNEQNGDAYAPANNGGAPFSGSNALYNGGSPNGGGYAYVVKFTADGGKVSVFDPGFCAMGSNPSGAGNLGFGDHWIGTAGTPVSTYYTLWNATGKLGFNPSSWGTPVYSSGTVFENLTGYDPANGSSPGGGATSGCDAYHNTWWTLGPVSLVTGTYVLQVSTTNPTSSTINNSTNAENMFAIEATGGGTPEVYGNGKMAVYNNLQPGTSYQLFYLAKIDRNTGAGKTALIDIFDPGDVNGNAILKILSPDVVDPITGLKPGPVSFSYTTDGNCNATVNYNGGTASDLCQSTANVDHIQTSLNGQSSFNNTWIHIRVALDASYGLNGLWGPGGGGWWQVRYETPGGGNDTTTWQVNLTGNPVHLVVP